MALRAVLLLKNDTAGLRRAGQRAVGIPVRAVAVRRQRIHVSGKGIQIRAEARFGIAKRLGASAGVEIGVAHQAGAESEIPDLAFKVLDLIKITGPMQRPVAGMAAERNRVAEAFAKLREIPHAAILATVVMATSATDVLLES